MKKKVLLATGLALCLTMSLATTAFAADGDEATKPGNPGGTQEAGMSNNAATIESLDGTTFNTTNDDDAQAKVDDVGGADINVWAKVVDSGSKIYKVDLAWGAMKFEFNSGGGQWNTDTHTYTGGSGSSAWTPSFIDGNNNKVGVTNHSNNGIDADFAYAMQGTAFNADATGNDAVLGSFFADNTHAETAAGVLTGTHNATAPVPAVNSISKVSLATADVYNSSVDAPTTVTDNQIAGARTDDVFFAFSGTPDAGKGADLGTFSKVGVITVTVTPNNTDPLNRPPFTP